MNGPQDKWKWVNADNKRAIHTYEKNGYEIVEPTMYLMTKK